MACARELVAAGYTHSFCTPHVWPNLPNNNVAEITRRVGRLQRAFDDAGIGLKLIPGGELNLREDTPQTPPGELVTFGMAGRHVLFDIWADRLPPFFAPAVRWLQERGLTAILAHPERMRAVQVDPGLMDRFRDSGLLLQGNLQCLGDPPGTPTRDLAERFLLEGRYFLLGSDLHNLPSLPIRLAGLRRAIELVGEEGVAKLTVEHPWALLPQ
jgi:protein-tyrosine phosphatase